MNSIVKTLESPVQILNVVALRHNIKISSCIRTWKIRAIIAAHREKNNLMLTGKGYGPDWKGYIKRDVVNYLKNGSIPYVVQTVATTLLISRHV